MFKRDVMTDQKNLWIVAFINPNCPGCSSLAKEFNKLATYQRNSFRKVKFAFIDTSLESSAEVLEYFTGDDKEIEYTPTILVYGRDKTDPIHYRGDLKIAALNVYTTIYCQKYGYDKDVRKTALSTTLKKRAPTISYGWDN